MNNKKNLPHFDFELKLEQEFRIREAKLLVSLISREELEQLFISIFTHKLRQDNQLTLMYKKSFL
jgi:hypothetical protein